MARRPRVEQATTRFINVDLDLASRRDITAVVQALSPSMHVLFNSRVRRTFRATLELGGRWAVQPAAPDKMVGRMVQLVQALPPRIRAEWDAATSRWFNLGFECGDTRLMDIELKPRTVQAVAEIGASIVVTLYPCDRAAASDNPLQQTGAVGAPFGRTPGARSRTPIPRRGSR